MNYLKTIALFIATYFTFIRSGGAFNIGIFQHYEVHIINNMNDTTNELIGHCKSADDDLGEHFLDNGEDWNWRFRVNFFRSTLFFCHLKWGELKKKFNAFDTDYISSQCEETSKCFWSVRGDGIYFSADNQNYVKTHPWP